MKLTLLLSLACLLLATQYLAYREWQTLLKLARVNPDDPRILPPFLFAALCGAVSLMSIGLSILVYLWIP